MKKRVAFAKMNFRVLEQIMKLEENIKIISVDKLNEGCDFFVIKIESPECPIVEEGQIIPYVDLIFDNGITKLQKGE